MKVQRRPDYGYFSEGEHWDVVYQGKDYYILKNANGLIPALKDKYEPVPEWVDVTGECDFEAGVGLDGQGGYHMVRNGVRARCNGKDYRLRKAGVAFIVERKVSH